MICFFTFNLFCIKIEFRVKNFLFGWKYTVYNGLNCCRFKIYPPASYLPGKKVGVKTLLRNIHVAKNMCVFIVPRTFITSIGIFSRIRGYAGQNGHNDA